MDDMTSDQGIRKFDDAMRNQLGHNPNERPGAYKR
jgi:hypothetical protein